MYLRRLSLNASVPAWCLARHKPPLQNSWCENRAKYHLLHCWHRRILRTTPCFVSSMNQPIWGARGATGESSAKACLLRPAVTAQKPSRMPDSSVPPNRRRWSSRRDCRHRRGSVRSHRTPGLERNCRSWQQPILRFLTPTDRQFHANVRRQNSWCRRARPFDQ
jgi:hypothetical protein